MRSRSCAKNAFPQSSPNELSLRPHNKHRSTIQENAFLYKDKNVQYASVYIIQFVWQIYSIILKSKGQ